MRSSVGFLYMYCILNVKKIFKKLGIRIGMLMEAMRKEKREMHETQINETALLHVRVWSELLSLA